jgi:hypothetical protein
MTQMEAIIKNDHVYPVSDVKLPQTCRVLITILPDESEDPIFDIDAIAVETGISDLAQNLDHYLYGKEKT